MYLQSPSTNTNIESSILDVNAVIHFITRNIQQFYKSTYAYNLVFSVLIQGNDPPTQRINVFFRFRPVCSVANLTENITTTLAFLRSNAFQVVPERRRAWRLQALSNVVASLPSMIVFIRFIETNNMLVGRPLQDRASLGCSVTIDEDTFKEVLNLFTSNTYHQLTIL